MNRLSQTVPLQYDTTFSPYAAVGWRAAFADLQQKGFTGVEIAVAYPDRIDADALLILTAVEQVCLNYGKPDEERLSRITVADCERYIEQKHFAPGSMLPKIQAAMRFASSKPGRRAIITSLDKAVDALAGKAGTVIVQ